MEIIANLLSLVILGAITVLSVAGCWWAVISMRLSIKYKRDHPDQRG